MGRVARLAIAAAVATGACATAASAADAGTNGQQIRLSTPVQQSVRACGVNQNGDHVCHVWQTPAASTELTGWWWSGPVTLQSFSDTGARRLLDTTVCDVPVRQRSDWTACDGFDYAAIHGDEDMGPAFQQFAIPHAGAAYGVVTIAFFISAGVVTAGAPPGMGGFGDARAFAPNGVPPREHSRVMFVLDYAAGVGVIRVDPSCVIAITPGPLPPAQCFGPNPIRIFSHSALPMQWGMARRAAITYVRTYARGPVHPGDPSVLSLQVEAANSAFRPLGAYALGEIAAQITLRTEPDGNLNAALSTKAFPSTEAYQLVKGHVRTLLRAREQGWAASAPIDAAPDPSALATNTFSSQVVTTRR